ncbi:MAG: hypothetical protein FWE67_01485 [Planctomycetaceae bacterium]|nr:hypothetical protein [Planctomycetaceae bacterium]
MFYLITPDNKLLHYFRRNGKDADITQFRNEDNAFKKAGQNPSAILFVQKTVEEIPAFIEKMPFLNPQFLERRFYVYVPDLPKVSVTLGTEIRFALLQAGATAVFGSLRDAGLLYF